MKMKFLCDCGADLYISAKGGADEATVCAVASWIRAHSLHGVRLIKKPTPASSQPASAADGKAPPLT